MSEQITIEATTKRLDEISAAFRAGFKAGFGASEDGFNGKNPLQGEWTDSDYDRRYKDHVERRVQAAEDAAFKAAYPDKAE